MVTKIIIQQRINKGNVPTMDELLNVYSKRELAEKLHKYLLKVQIMKENNNLK